MKSFTISSTTARIAVIAILLACTTAFTVNPTNAVHRSLQTSSMTKLFHKASILERPLKEPKKKQNIKSKPKMYSIIEATELPVGSLILSLNDPQVRHKVRRRPRKIADVDREKRQRKAMRSFQEGQELARLAVQEVLREHNIHDITV